MSILSLQDSARSREKATSPDNHALRTRILNLAEGYFASLPPATFVPGETYLLASGKVLDANNLRLLIDASLDMWLTSGRYTEAFENAGEGGAIFSTHRSFIKLAESYRDCGCDC